MATSSCINSLLNILIIEDDGTTTKLLAEALASPVVTIHTARRLKVARQIINQYNLQWHCWILDIDLGEKYNSLDLMKKYHFFPFTVILSGLNNMRISFEAARLGALEVFDKNPCTSLNTIVDEVYRISALGYILKGKQSDYLSVFLPLRKNIFISPAQWADHACITLRYLERLCEIHTGMSPRYVLPLYYYIFSLIYLSRHQDEQQFFYQHYSHSARKHFNNCSKFVMEHWKSKHFSFPGNRVEEFILKTAKI